MLRYETSIEMDEEECKNETTCDEWGCACVWHKTLPIGAEYNFCREGGDEYSAIYFMTANEDLSYMETNHLIYESYLIDFTDPSWREKLIDAMIKFVEEEK